MTRFLRVLPATGRYFLIHLLSGRPPRVSLVRREEHERRAPEVDGNRPLNRWAASCPCALVTVPAPDRALSLRPTAPPRPAGEAESR